MLNSSILSLCLCQEIFFYELFFLKDMDIAVLTFVFRLACHMNFNGQSQKEHSVHGTVFGGDA